MVGNLDLAHKFTGLYIYIFFLYDLDIFNTLKTKNIGNTD